MVNLFSTNISFRYQGYIISFFLILLEWTFFLLKANGQSKLEFSVMPSFAKNDMSWSIAGNLEGSSPNIYSELKFNDIKSLGNIVVLKYNPINYLSLIIKGERFQTIDGYGSDIDYQKDNRTDISYMLNFNSSKGNIESYSFFAISDLRDFFILDFGFTYGQSTQRYYLNSIEHPDLNSYYNYKSKVYGVIFSKEYKIFNKFFAKNELLLNRLNYESAANWNLIDKFQHPKSFEHFSSGYLFRLNSLISYTLMKATNIILGFDYQYENLGKGLDIAYLKNGYKELTQFNGAYRRGIQFGMGITYEFF